MSSGGKAESLIKLQKAGFLVPPFFVCDTTSSEQKILSELEQKLPEVSHFAVRSSSLNEDTAEKSFAGHFYSGVGVTRKNVYSEFLKVKKSLGNIGGAVIIQEFIPSDKAGVLFTEVDNDRIVINASIGLCLSVVTGKACDEYICDKNGQIISKTVSKNKEINTFDGNKIISGVSSAESLTQKEVQELANLGKKIQEFFGAPRDIEWCFKAGKLYLLQSRPITKDFAVKNTGQEYFDSANIAESYSGIVLPLTCSFAQMIYEQVYKDLLKNSGVPEQKIEQHSEIFKNLLGFFYGRMYYNMNNWYLMAAFLPGYQRNKENFELMITSNVKQSITTSIKPSFLLRAFYPLILVTKLISFGSTSQRFKTAVQEELRKLREKDFSHLNYEDSINLFGEINNNLLRKWYVAAENDFLVMTYLGFLKKLLGEKLLRDVIIFPSKATDQVRALALLSKEMEKIKPLWKAVEENDVDQFDKELVKKNAIKKNLDAYLLTFGGRFANELKLESIGVDEDKTKLFSVLRVYSNYNSKEYGKEKPLKLTLQKKLLVGIVLSRFKKYSSQREEFRLLRSNAFGMTRGLFRHMGALLLEREVLKNIEDVFYLRLSELMNLETLSNKDINKTIQKRKIDYEFYNTVTPPTHFATVGKQEPPVISSKKLQVKTIYAHPASSGVVKGRVKVFKEFSMPKEIDFDILVTSHTDPGWTSLIALSKGLIIEHGGVLSHASIVARELGIPAVIGAENAVQSLSDGQIVEIDGTNGIVQII
ncbi:MAG: PEP/pyruvate-binding domain-containing protein [bacterium]|nr:PEP/pyruvate-binding domain-containing protein [bacterium]